jgi:hypothetical protein
MKKHKLQLHEDMWCNHKTLRISERVHDARSVHAQKSVGFLHFIWDKQVFYSRGTS